MVWTAARITGPKAERIQVLSAIRIQYPFWLLMIIMMAFLSQNQRGAVHAWRAVVPVASGWRRKNPPPRRAHHSCRATHHYHHHHTQFLYQSFSTPFRLHSAKYPFSSSTSATLRKTATRLSASSSPNNNNNNNNNNYNNPTWRKGDKTFINIKNSEDYQEAMIEEVRGSGWFTVRLTATQQLQKVRTSQLLTAAANNPKDSGNSDTRENTVVADDLMASATSTPSKVEDTGTIAGTFIQLEDLPLEEPVQAIPAMTVNVEENDVAIPPVSANESKISSPLPPPPRMDNLDTIIQNNRHATTTKTDDSAFDEDYLQQVAHHATAVQHWVVFTDLHVAPSSLNTTLQVLRRVHELALERQAGIICLGDFWHHRGTLRVDCLNAILAELKSWQVPLVMMPGNHDQVTLGGQSHSLTPMEQAYRCTTTISASGSSDTTAAITGDSVPGPLIFSHPTLFAGALFVPHIRDLDVLTAVLQSDMAQHEAQAIFVHADVTGAYMNDLIVSTGGVHPSVFPASKPIYSGHFHKPHTVTYQNSGNKEKQPVAIEYVGSPYETSLAEAQQAKALVVLDASQQWKCIERIPISVGRKHFKPKSLVELLQFSLATKTSTPENPEMSTSYAKAGDRIVASLSRSDMKALEEENEASTTGFGDHIRGLRKGGVTIELRETKNKNEGENIPTVTSVDTAALEEMTPVSTWKHFCEEQILREIVDEQEGRALQEAGLALLDELDESTSRKENESSLARDLLLATTTNLELEAVTVEGYGPFVGRVHYPLKERGLVLLRGSNEDGGSDSNGSGKTSLAMAALWALTGSADPRPFQDNKVSDVVNDSVQNACVVISGCLNGRPFTITRTKSPKKSGLAFVLDGVDLTTQTAKETMTVIDETLGVSAPILARTMFHGQHAINDLLEATDAKLKEELSLVTPLELWQAAAKLSRAKGKEATTRGSELQGKISLRTEDVEKLRDRCANAATELHTRECYLEAKEKEYMVWNTEYGDEGGQLTTTDSRESSLQAELTEAKSTFDTLQAKASNINEERDVLLKGLNLYLARAIQEEKKATQEYQRIQLKSQSATITIEALLSRIKGLEAKWQVDLSTGIIPDDFNVPDTCPTCLQPVLVEQPDKHGHGHDYQSLQDMAEGEISEALSALQNSKSNLGEIQEDLEKAGSTRKESEEKVLNAQEEIKAKSVDWEEISLSAQEELRQYQAKVTDLTESYAAEYEQQQKANLERSMVEAQLGAARESVRYAKAAHDELISEIVRMEAILLELTAEAHRCQGTLRSMSRLSEAFGNRGIQTFVLQNSVHDLEILTQGYLDDFSDGAQRLQFTLDAGDRILRRSLVREPDGSFRDRPLATLSGGQWRRSSLALTLGFADLVAQKGKLRPSLMVLDEPLTFLDRTGRSDVGKVLRKILGRSKRHDPQGTDDSGRKSRGISKLSSVSTIIMILQDLAAEELEEAFDHIDEVVKQDGSSSVKVDETSELQYDT